MLRRRNRREHREVGERREVRWRSTRWVAVGVVGALGITAATGIGSSGAAPQAPAAPAQASFNLGVGQAIAQGIKVDPRAAGLSLGITMVESLAGHQNTVAAGESKAINLGIIGTTLAAEGCDGGDPTLPSEQQPQALRRDSTEPDSAAGVQQEESVVPGTPITKYVRATTDPFAEAITTAAPIPIPGVGTIAGITSTATSGVINGNMREARATSDIGSINIAGLVSIGGMHWEATHRSGAVEEHFGSFAIGSMTIAGVPVPVQDPNAALSAANTALGLLGIEIRPPVAHVEETAAGSVLFVDPLGIAVVPSAQRDTLIGGILSGVQPVREALFDQILALDCGNATYILVADIALGSVTGAGSFALELGGAQASTSEINAFQGLGLGGAGRFGTGALSATAPAAAPSISSGPTGGTSGGSTVAAAPATPVAAAPVAAPTNDVTGAVDTAVDLTGERGGAMLAVGLAGLVALAIAAELDRRKMRRAQREILLEV